VRRVREPGDVADYSARVTQRGPDQPCCCVGRFPEVGTEPAREIVTFESSCSHRDATTGCHLHRASTASSGGEQPLPALPFGLTCGWPSASSHVPVPKPSYRTLPLVGTSHGVE